LNALLFDSHAHYDDGRFDTDRAAVIEKIKNSGVGGVVNVGADMQSSARSLRLSERYDFIYASVGVHPHDARHMTEDGLATLEQWAAHPKAVAIGEIGLDYHYDNSPRAAQKYWFERQLELARRVNLPVIIHTREAIRDTMDILEKSGVTGVVHCFSENAEVARRLLDMGFYLAFGGTLTYKNARDAEASAREAPLDRILLETDCPYLAPDGHRGERNDSALMRVVCERLAQIKGVSYDAAANATFQNARRVYRIDNQL
jgi:TatD DNase family protein